jgi:cellobiose-specific phosphotransferase system component IIA
MKILIIIILFIVAFAAAGYFGLPIIIEKETAVLKSDVQDLKLRIQKIEEESKAAPLKPDADLQQVIKAVNAVSSRVASLDDSVKKDISRVDETIKKQNSATEEAFKKQSGTIDKIDKETRAITQKIMFDATMTNIRGYILKARGDLQYRNIGTVKNELDLISEAFEKAKATATDENKKVIEELQGIVKKAKAELDTDLPAAMNRIDLLWYEMEKLLKKA